RSAIGLHPSMVRFGGADHEDPLTPPDALRRAAGYSAHGDIVAGEAYKRVTWGDTFVAVHCVQPVARASSVVTADSLPTATHSRRKFKARVGLSGPNKVLHVPVIPNHCCAAPFSDVCYTPRRVPLREVAH